tara:strand:- start:352 stop:1449 length:1098 start_codon:yes stop_codon:yes gene_type:complete
MQPYGNMSPALLQRANVMQQQRGNNVPPPALSAPEQDPKQVVAQAQAILSNPQAPVEAKNQASQIIQEITAGNAGGAPQGQPPMLSQSSYQPIMPERPTAPSAPTYGGNVGAQMFAQSQAAAGQGGNAMYAGMAAGYNQGKQSEYNAELNTYKAEQKQYEDGVARYNTAMEKGRARQKAFQQEVTPLYNQVDKLRTAKARLYENPDKIKNDITGMFESSRIRDLMTNDPVAAEREVTRKILNDLGVDYTLLKTAKTKGAISDREMAMFASGTMSMNNSEAQWSQWIDGQIEAMSTVIRNLEEIESGVRQPYERNQWGNVDSLIKGSSPAPNSPKQNSGGGNTPSAPTPIDLSDYGIPEGAVTQIK